MRIRNNNRFNLRILIGFVIKIDLEIRFMRNFVLSQIKKKNSIMCPSLELIEIHQKWEPPFNWIGNRFP